MFEGRSIPAVVGTAIAAFIGISAAAERNADGAIMTAGAVDAFEVQIGDCFDDEAFESTEVSELPALPCSEPHDNEVYATFDLTGDWPGEDVVEELAFEGCFERFAEAIGRSYEESVIDYTSIYPSKGSWNQVDDREVICVGYHMEFDKLTGSIIRSGL